MKKVMYAFIIVILMALSLSNTQAYAQGPSGDWVSTIYCLNQEAVDASLTLIFYDQTGSVELTFTDDVGPNQSVYYYPQDLTGLDGFSGGVVIESSASLSCSVDSSSSSAGTQGDPFRLAASSGFDINSASPVMYTSQVLKNFDSGAFGFYNSYIAIQNTSSASVMVTVEFTDRGLGDIAAATEQFEINPQSNKIVYLDENADLPDGFLGSAKVSANDGTTPLAVQAVFYNNATDYTKAQFHMYNGASQGESKLYAPFIMRNFYDFNGGINVVNVGSAPTSFKIVFTIGRSTTNTYTYQLDRQLYPGQLVALFMPDVDALDPVDSLPMSERAGSAIIYATDLNGDVNPAGELISNINFRNDGRDPANPNFGGQAVTYNAVGADEGSQTLFIPNIQNEVTNAEFTSGINLANMTNTAGSCTFDFVGQTGFSVTRALPASGIYSVLVSDITGLNSGYSDGVIITCNVDATAVITMRANASGYWGDSQSAINSIAAPAP